MKKQGYSIIELLVVLGVLGLIVLIVSGVIINTLRGAARVNSDTEIRQDLNYALSVMERSLRNATSVNCDSSSQISYIDQDKVSGSFYQATNENVGFIASSSDNSSLTGPSVNITALVFTCHPQNGNTPPSVDISITGRDAVRTGPEQGNGAVSTTVYLRSSQ